MYVIGLDIGTTGTKAVLTDICGNVISKGYRGYPLISKGSCVEQDANEWVNASIEAIKAALSGNEDKKVAAISLSTQGASTVAIDKDGKTIGNAYTWMDTRSVKEAEALKNELGDDFIYKMSGWKINATLDAAKIKYMKKQPEFKNAAKFYSTLEFVNMFLTGCGVIDPSNASIRQLFDVNTLDWNDRVLSAVGVSRDELPQVLPSGALVGSLTKEAADILGLEEGMPVFNGAHDQYCASLGAAATSSGDMLLSTGTTWVVLGIGTKPLFTDTFISPGIHPAKGLYGSIASINGSGVSLEWFKNKFMPGCSYAEIDGAAEQSPRTDLFFYPYVVGANYPIWNLNARGSFQGITLEHSTGDFARAIMEGAAFGVKTTLKDFAANGNTISSLKLMGGASKSPFWSTLITDIAGVETQTLAESDACAIGAAVIAATGIGAYADFNTAAHAMVRVKDTKAPNPGLQEYYNKKHERYTELWNCIYQYYKN